jgi:hypothetical protein
MHKACTSLEMQSGINPLASTARAVLNENEPMPDHGMPTSQNEPVRVMMDRFASREDFPAPDERTVRSTVLAVWSGCVRNRATIRRPDTGVAFAKVDIHFLLV